MNQTAIDNMKTAITKDVVLVYPDYSQEFEVYTDSSKLQIVVVITQNNRPLHWFTTFVVSSGLIPQMVSRINKS